MVYIGLRFKHASNSQFYLATDAHTLLMELNLLCLTGSMP